MVRDFTSEEYTTRSPDSHGHEFDINKHKLEYMSERRQDEPAEKKHGSVCIRDDMNYHLRLIVNEYKRRVAKNPRYSLRAYASFLNLDPSALSRILAGKQELSVKAGLSIVKRLQMSEDDGRRFLLSVIEGRRRNEAARVGRLVSSPHLRPVPAYINPDVFEKIADLNAIALLELTQTEDFNSDPEWIAERLEIDVNEAKALIDNLLSVGLLKLENGQLVSMSSYLTAACCERSKQARKRVQEQVLKRAAYSLKEESSEKSLFFGMTMAIDASKIELAARRIREFLDNLSDELSTLPRSEVYHLAIQFFPLTARRPEDFSGGQNQLH